MHILKYIAYRGMGHKKPMSWAEASALPSLYSQKILKIQEKQEIDVRRHAVQRKYVRIVQEEHPTTGRHVNLAAERSIRPMAAIRDVENEKRAKSAEPIMTAWSAEQECAEADSRAHIIRWGGSRARPGSIKGHAEEMDRRSLDEDLVGRPSSGLARDRERDQKGHDASLQSLGISFEENKTASRPSTAFT